MADQLTLDFTAEIWKPVVGWPEYQISNQGNIRRAIPEYVPSWRKGKSSAKKRPAGSLLKPFDNGKGYLRVGLSHNGKATSVDLHILICRAFCDPPLSPAHTFVAHWDGNPRNNAPHNLRWATPKENQEDMVRHGRSLRGSKQPGSRLKETQIAEIRRLGDSGVQIRPLARQFGVDRRTIGRVLRRETWGWIE